MNVLKAKIRDGYGENAEDGVFAHVERRKRNLEKNAVLAEDEDRVDGKEKTGMEVRSFSLRKLR